MTKVLILPDTHLKWRRANAILAHESHDLAILLGDHFDDFNDTVEENRDAAIWLKDSLSVSNRVHLIANHDISYAYPQNPHTRCSGFGALKSKAINEVLTRANWDKLKLYHAQDGILFSHAGLSMSLINQERLPRDLDDLLAELDRQEPVARAMLEGGKAHWMYGCGWSRGGNRPYGGFTWSDFDNDFVPTPFGQCVGHTPHDRVSFRLRQARTPGIIERSANEMSDIDLSKSWWAVDLDTHLTSYAILENGVLTVREIAWDGAIIRYVFDVFSGSFAQTAS